jgi:beta-glucanase (GH16 family)
MGLSHGHNILQKYLPEIKLIRMNKFQISIILIAIMVFIGFSSCSDSDDDLDYEIGFDYEIDSSDPNTVIFTNTSTGDYLYVQWDFGNDESTGKESDLTSERSAYYPLAGNYEVTLTIWGPLNTISDTKTLTQTITIESDDPDYDTSEQLVWSDEFSSSTINTANWTFETGAGGWGNQELQNYTDGDNASVQNGVLVITAKKVNDNKTYGSYTSTRMISWGKQEFTYGRIEVRAKLPSGTGVWPAIWMLGTNLSEVSWPACGEIDIMEYVGYDPSKVHSSIHTTSSSGSTVNTSEITVSNCEEEFNIYGLIWTEESLSFYVNDQENPFYTYAPAVKTSANWPFDNAQFLILNLAVGGTWGGAQGIDNTIFPQTLEIDYVRVYQ